VTPLTPPGQANVRLSTLSISRINEGTFSLPAVGLSTVWFGHEQQLEKRVKKKKKKGRKKKEISL